MSQHNHFAQQAGARRRSRGFCGSAGFPALALVVLPLACGSATAPLPGEEEPSLAPLHAVLHGPPDHTPPLLERAWSNDRMSEMLKPRPPGLGTPEERTVPFYVLAPVMAGDPLSPPAEIPGILVVGGRDHVVPTPTGNRGSFRAVARTVGLQHPGWDPRPPFQADHCDTVAHDDRIAWAWVDVSGPGGHPCGRVAFVFAVQLDGDSCVTPITNIERVGAAIDEGLVNPSRPPEPAWPATIRPMTAQGAGPTAPAAPSGCVPPGERVD